jgi:hypothetical protein
MTLTGGDYVCSGCAKNFALRPGTTNAFLVLFSACMVLASWHQKPDQARAFRIRQPLTPLNASLLAVFLMLWVARDIYYRWRYPRLH